MTTPSLPQAADTPQSYSIKEFQLLVRDAPVVPAEIEPFVGAPLTSSRAVFERFRKLAEMPVEAFLALHLDGKNRIVGMTTCSIGSMTASMAHPRDVFRPAVANLTAGLIFVHYVARHIMHVMCPARLCGRPATASIDVGDNVSKKQHNEGS